VNFYNTLFGQEATVRKDDYAKWMLDDPRINFAISQRPARAGSTGLDHLGFQLESSEELHSMTAQLANANIAVTGQGETTCCYAKSDKGWVHDPQGIAWESFVTFGEATTYGVENTSMQDTASGACCAPSVPATTSKPKVSLKDIQVQGAASCGTGSSTVKTGATSCC
jgi:hypothetical protein